MFNTRIPIYGVFILLSIIFGLLVIFKSTNKIKLKKEEKYALIIYLIIGTIFGAKYFTFIVNYQEYIGVFEFEKIGLSSYGAIIGIIIILFIFSKIFKKKFKDLIYIITPAIPLMYGIGKIGCFFSGCCYGIEYNGPFKVIYNYSFSAPRGVPLFPVQIVETIVFILIFICIYTKIKKEVNNYKLIGVTFVLCGLAKFSLDYLRMSHINQILSLNQIVSIIFILVGLYIIIINRIKTNE